MAVTKELFSARTEDGQELQGENLNQALKGKLERLLSEILSDQYDCNIKLSFAPQSSVEDYSKYDSMSTEELEDILRMDFEAEDSDTDMILHITQILVQREEKNPTGLFDNVNESWEAFKEKYLT